MSLITRGREARAASVSRKARRVRRAKTSMGLSAYSCVCVFCGSKPPSSWDAQNWTGSVMDIAS